MAGLRRFEVDELVNRPGTYVNPHTEMIIVVDDSAAVDQELLGGDDDHWILVADEVPLDETTRDDLLERLQRRASRARPPAAAFEDAETLGLEGDEDDEEDDFRRAGFDYPRTREDDDESY